MRRIERYGKMVWENEEFEDQRKGNCLCHQCSKMKPGDEDHCKVASKFYEVCKEHGCAFILTRCEDYQKREEKCANPLGEMPCVVVKGCCEKCEHSIENNKED
jgi:hypothetical protein